MMLKYSFNAPRSFLFFRSFFVDSSGVGSHPPNSSITTTKSFALDSISSSSWGFIWFSSSVTSRYLTSILSCTASIISHSTRSRAASRGPFSPKPESPLRMETFPVSAVNANILLSVVLSMARYLCWPKDITTLWLSSDSMRSTSPTRCSLIGSIGKSTSNLGGKSSPLMWFSTAWRITNAKTHSSPSFFTADTIWFVEYPDSASSSDAEFLFCRNLSV